MSGRRAEGKGSIGGMRIAAALLLAASVSLGLTQAPGVLWVEATSTTIGETGGWTNKVEIADIDNDGRLDLLFANGGDYSTPGKPEQNQAFVNRGPGKPF